MQLTSNHVDSGIYFIIIPPISLNERNKLRGLFAYTGSGTHLIGWGRFDEIVSQYVLWFGWKVFNFFLNTLIFHLLF